MTPSTNYIQHNRTLFYAECRDFLNVMLCVIMLNVVMVNVVMRVGATFMLIIVGMRYRKSDYAFSSYVLQLRPPPAIRTILRLF